MDALGEVSERPKERDWKSRTWLTAASRVQIPPSPSRAGEPHGSPAGPSFWSRTVRPLPGLPAGSRPTVGRVGCRMRYTLGRGSSRTASRAPSPCPCPSSRRPTAGVHEATAASIRFTAVARAVSVFIRAIAETHLPNALAPLRVRPVGGAERVGAHLRAQLLARLRRVEPAAGRAAASSRRCRTSSALIRTFRIRTVCSLSVNAKLESTTSEMPVTWYEPTSASACAYVETCVPGCTWLVSYRGVGRRRSGCPTRSRRSCEQPVNDGVGPRYTKTFFSPAGVCTRTWKRGDPALQSSSVTSNSV